MKALSPASRFISADWSNPWKHLRRNILYADAGVATRRRRVEDPSWLDLCIGSEIEHVDLRLHCVKGMIADQLLPAQFVQGGTLPAAAACRRLASPDSRRTTALACASSWARLTSVGFR